MRHFISNIYIDRVCKKSLSGYKDWRFNPALYQYVLFQEEYTIRIALFDSAEDKAPEENIKYVHNVIFKHHNDNSNDIEKTY